MATFISISPEQTQALGADWGRVAHPGWLIGLHGDLGAGKTQLVKGLARGLGVTEPVRSPTFALVHQYVSGRLPLVHLDFYRLETPRQILAAGLEEFLHPSQGITIVEWIERWIQTVERPASDRRPPGTDPSRCAEAVRQAGLTIARWRGRFRYVHLESVTETERRITYEDFGD